MKSLKSISKIQTKIKTVLTQMISVGVVAIIGLFLIEAPASGFSGSGAGTVGNPYQITNATQLQEMQDDLNAHYVLAGDIDCSDTVTWNDGKGFEPIGGFFGGHWVNFRGTFDGQGHIITGLFINRPSTYVVGLFGVAEFSTIKNVGLEDVNISGGCHKVGALLGETHYVTVSNCYSTGNVNGNSIVAGLSGGVFHSTLSNCYSTADVNGNNYFGSNPCDTGNHSVGGLAGGLCDGEVINSYSTGSVSGNLNVGGLAGSIGCEGSRGIHNCYSTGSVTGTDRVGGLVGSIGKYHIVSDSYSTGSVTGNSDVGGLVGYNNGTITNCYYNNHAGNPSVGIGSGPGYCTAIDNNVSYFYYSSNPPMSSWNFVNVWGIYEGCSYPYLLWHPHIVDTTPPEITCPADVTVEQESYDGTVVPLEATATDICGPDPVITSDELAIYPLGVTIVTFTATDASGNSASCSMSVTVVDTTPPEITCPADVTVEQESYGGTVVPLEATATDICDPDPVINSDELAIYPLGVTIVTFTATDASGNSASCSMSVTVVDTTPPTIHSISASPDVLWPVNHKMVEVTVTVDCEDMCDPEPVCQIVNVTSNEPINGLGDGNTDPDWVITGDLTVQLRAERAGVGTDRIYTIEVKCEDASGNISTATVDVTVPHDQGKGKK